MADRAISVGDGWAAGPPARRLAGLGPSAIRQLAEGAPEGTLSLGLGEPDWPFPEPARQALARASSCRYGPNGGLDALRAVVAEYHGAADADVLITTGSQGALFALLQAWLEPGCTVMLPDPGFPAYGALATMAGARVSHYQLTTGGGLDAAELCRRLDEESGVRAVILNHPSNPTGGVAEPTALAQVASHCAARGTLLISDEVYGELYLDQRPAGLRDATDYGVVVNSVSKAWGAPGLRVGWAVGDARWLRPAALVHSHAATAASSIAQTAALALLHASDDVLPKAREHLRIRWRAMEEALAEFFPRPVAKPAGGFYIWLPLPAVAWDDPMQFCLRLRDEAGVVVVPGTIFGPSGGRHIRLSFACDPLDIRQGVRRLAPHWSIP